MYQYPLRMDKNEKEILFELKDKMNHLSLNDIIITAIKLLSKREFEECKN